MRAEKFKTVCSFDPNLETERISEDDMIAFLRERDIKSVEPAMQGKNPPTIFHMREIPHELWESYVGAASTEGERYKRAFMCGVERVENVYQRDGIPISDWMGSDKPQKFGDVTLSGLMSSDDLKLFSPAERQEIGSVAYQHSFLPRRIASCFRLPHSCLQTLTGRTYRAAEPSPTDAPKPSAEQSA